MTSIEWFANEIEKLLPDFIGVWQEEFEQAKEMHKQEIINAYEQGGLEEYQHHVNAWISEKTTAEQYYNETFKQQ